MKYALIAAALLIAAPCYANPVDDAEAEAELTFQRIQAEEALRDQQKLIDRLRNENRRLQEPVYRHIYPYPFEEQ